MVGAGSVVTRDVPADTSWPATRQRVFRHRQQRYRGLIMISSGGSDLDSMAATILEKRIDRAQHAQSPDVVRVGVIGYGYWGPNIVRNLHALDSCEVVAVCDKSPAALKRAQRAYPGRPADDRLSPRCCDRPTSMRWRSSRRCGRISSWPRRRSKTASTCSSRSRSRPPPRRPRS